MDYSKAGSLSDAVFGKDVIWQNARDCVLVY